jgi:hypothetical protein
MKEQTFAHRPPSEGVHLLSDPFPERVESPAATQTKTKTVTQIPQAKDKKSRKSGHRS